MAHRLGWLVRLFPAPFRDEFGREMAGQLAHDFARARARGRRAAAWFWWRSVIDLTSAALAERLHPTCHPAGAAGRFKEPFMRRLLDGWRLDLTHAARALGRAPGFTAVTTSTLALAIGITVALFAIVHAVLLAPMPYGDERRLVYVTGEAPGSDITGEFGVASTEAFLHYRERSALLEDFATFSTFTSTMRTDDRVERIRMADVTHTFFSTLNSVPALGRLPVAADDDRVVLISDTLWATWFGRDPAVVGRTYAIGGGPRQIIGVMPPDFRFPADNTLLWISSAPAVTPSFRPGNFGTNAIARTKPGVSPAQIGAELTSLTREFPARFGGSPDYARLVERYRVVTRPLIDEILDGTGRTLWVLFASGAIVLLIACANVANLFLVRSEGRLREMAVRQAVGAERGQLIRVQLAESVLIAAVAGTIAVIVARVSLPALLRVVPDGVPRLGDAHVGVMSMLFAMAMAGFAALACGLGAALRASRPRLSWLREGARGATRRRGWGRDALVGAQTALALVLLIGSGLLLRSYAKLSQVDPGYDTRDVFTFQFAPEQPALRSGPAYAHFALDFMDRVRALPGVQAVGLVENVPLDEGTASTRFRTEASAGNPDAAVRLSVTFSAGDHFKAMGTKVLQGRPFSNDDATGMLGNVVISASAAKALFPGRDPIGQRIQRDGTTTWETVIGVVEDVIQLNYRLPPSATVYLPMTGHTPEQWRLSTPGFVVKTSRAETIAPDIRAIIRQMAPEAPMYRTYTMALLERRQMGALSFTMLALGLISAMALILGALGLYGVLSYVVAERTQEIGVRMALGAQAGAVRWMVVRQGLTVVAVGVAIGLGAALAVTSSLGRLLYGVQPLDAVTFAGTSATMLAVGLLSSYLPARRASAVDPITSLRG